MCFILSDTATTEIYTLSLHDALPISRSTTCRRSGTAREPSRTTASRGSRPPSWTSGSSSRDGEADVQLGDRKSTRLNSSHRTISYAVFCLKKKKKTQNEKSN